MSAGPQLLLLPEGWPGVVGLSREIPEVMERRDLGLLWLTVAFLCSPVATHSISDSQSTSCLQGLLQMVGYSSNHLKRSFVPTNHLCVFIYNKLWRVPSLLVVAGRVGGGSRWALTGMWASASCSDGTVLLVVAFFCFFYCPRDAQARQLMGKEPQFVKILK